MSFSLSADSILCLSPSNASRSLKLQLHISRLQQVVRLLESTDTMGLRRKPDSTRADLSASPPPLSSSLRRLSFCSLSGDGKERLDNLPHSRTIRRYSEPVKESRTVRFQDHAANIPEETTREAPHRRSTPWTEKTLLSLGKTLLWSLPKFLRLTEVKTEEVSEDIGPCLCWRF